MGNSEQPKRGREKKIQAWLDPDNDAQKAALEIFENYRRASKENTPSVILTEALHSLHRERKDFKVILPSHQNDQERKLNTLLTMVSNISGLLQNGHLVASPQAQGELQQFEDDLAALSGIEETAASNYRTVNYDEDDE